MAVQLVAAIGSDTFAQSLLAAAAQSLPSSHCTIFALQNNGRVKSVSSASSVGEAASLTAVQYMGQGFDKQDSNMRWLKRKRPAEKTQLWVHQQTAEEVVDAHYRRICYEEVGIRERLSVLALMPDGYRVAISFYRHHAFALFGAADFEWLSSVALVIANCVHRHSQLTASTASATGGIPWLRTLSGRERQMVSLIAAGHTTQEVADEMGVALTTALTYRYRAFQHLGVRNIRELLGKVL
ncbi:MAG: helix-turn-helix transcriptional regulator [Comamonas sp.]|jgi:DNA-binding CsgD family transcriptional regulator|nr:helix-turn-helix transcriptional regulator [Comamonas sp.]